MRGSGQNDETHFLEILETLESQRIAAGNYDDWVELQDLAERLQVNSDKASALATQLFQRHLLILDQSRRGKLLVRSKTASIVKDLYRLSTQVQRLDVRDVSDLKYIRYVKRIPKVVIPLASNQTIGEFKEALDCEGGEEEKVIAAAIESVSSLYANLSPFQVRAALSICRALSRKSYMRSLVIQADTGAGKSLAYQLPLMLRILQKKTRAYFSSAETPKLSTTGLLLFPRNVLAKDQYDGLNELASAANRSVEKLRFPSDLVSYLRIETVNDFGGVSFADKLSIYRGAPDVIITNPDTLKRRLMDAISAPSYAAGVDLILYDEIHLYSGLFGAHVAALNARLQSLLPSPPVFLGMSATIANAQKHCQKLFALMESPELTTDQGDQSEEFAVEHHVILKPRAGRSPLGVCIDATSALLHNRRGDMKQVHLMVDAERRPKSLFFVDSLDAAGRWANDQRDYEYFDQVLPAVRLRFTRGYPVHFSPWADDGAVTQSVCVQCKTRVATIAASCPCFNDGRCWWFSQDSAEPARWLAVRNGVVPDDNIRVKRVTRQEVDLFQIRDIYDLFRNPGQPFSRELPVDALIASPVLEAGVDFIGVKEIALYGEIRSPTAYKQRAGRGAREGNLEDGLFILSVIPFTPLANFYYRHFKRLVFPSLSPLPLEPRNPDVMKSHALCSVFDFVAKNGFDIFNIIQSREDPEVVEHQFEEAAGFVMRDRTTVEGHVSTVLKVLGESEARAGATAKGAVTVALGVIGQLSSKFRVGDTSKTLVRWIFEAFRQPDVMRDLEDEFGEKLEARSSELRLITDAHESLNRSSEKCFEVAKELSGLYDTDLRAITELAKRIDAGDISIIEALKKSTQQLRDKARWDNTLKSESYDRLLSALRMMDDALSVVGSAAELNESTVRTEYTRALSFKTIVEDIKSREGSFGIPPSYLYDVAPSLCVPPFTIPKNLAEAEGTERVSVSLQGRVVSERAELALGLLFPGSTTYRYGAPAKVRTGPWFQSGRARLSTSHELSPKPEFELQLDGKTAHVHKPATLRATTIPAREYVCASCLSLLDGDEGCNHGHPIQLKLPSSHPIIVKQELNRIATDSREFSSPLNAIIKDVTYLPSVEVGIAVTGFERTVPLPGGQRTVAVDYDPPIGFRLATSGISFRTISLDNIVGDLLKTPVFQRDMVVQLLSSRVVAALRQEELPLYNHELILSALVKSIGLDAIQDWQTVNGLMRDPAMTQRVLQEIAREQAFYESPPLALPRQLRITSDVFDANLTEAELRGHSRVVLLHSLAHVILLGCAVTSGSHLDDIDYIVKDNEVIVFDSVSGGNGSSAMAFEFLSAPGTFKLEEYLGTEEREELYRPRYMDETLLELLLPCPNGIADRAFLFGTVYPSEMGIVRKIAELRDKQNTHSRAIERLRQYGVQSLYPVGIGYHAIDYSRTPQDADRFKETSSVCLHGCPECISLGRKCSAGSFRERFSVSKYSLDRWFANAISPFIRDEPHADTLQEGLREHGLAILRVRCPSSADYQTRTKGAMEMILGIAGSNLNGKHVKFAGHWIDIDRETQELTYYYLLTVI